MGARSSSTRRAGSVAGFAFGQCVERARQSDQPIGFLPERLVGRGIGRDDAVAQRLEIALQVRQRRPQLVSRVRDELSSHPFLFLERCGHLVERIGERGDLLRPVARNAGRVVAIRDPPGGGADLAERSRQHPRDEHGQADGERDGQDHRGDEDATDRLVEHGLRRLGCRAVGHHQGRERVCAQDRHAKRKDRHCGPGRDQRRQRDARGQPAAGPRAPARG